MSFIKLWTVALIASASLAACSTYDRANVSHNTSTSQVKDSDALLHMIKPSSAKAIVGQVTGVVAQDRTQQRVTILAQDGHTYTVAISHASLGQDNAYQMQQLAIGDYIEVVAEPAQSDTRQLTVRAMPYVLRTIIIADHTAECVGVAPQTCLLTKPAGQADSPSDWEYRYSGIDGFEYEPNYEYTLLIQNTTIKNPPADASSIRSKLIEVIEKKKTNP